MPEAMQRLKQRNLLFPQSPWAGATSQKFAKSSVIPVPIEVVAKPLVRPSPASFLVGQWVWLGHQPTSTGPEKSQTTEEFHPQLLPSCPLPTLLSDILHVSRSPSQNAHHMSWLRAIIVQDVEDGLWDLEGDKT